MFPQTWTRPRRWLIVAGVAALAVVCFRMTGLETVQDLRASIEQERALEAEVLQLEAQNAALDAEIQSLQRQGWEKLARERLGLAKPGEYVVKIPGKK